MPSDVTATTDVTTASPLYIQVVSIIVLRVRRRKSYSHTLQDQCRGERGRCLLTSRPPLTSPRHHHCTSKLYRLSACRPRSRAPTTHTSGAPVPRESFSSTVTDCLSTMRVLVVLALFAVRILNLTAANQTGTCADIAG